MLLSFLVSCSHTPADPAAPGDEGKPTPNPASDFEYVLASTGDGICITKYLGASKDVVIPDKIEGHPVTYIGYGAFVGADIESVTFPDSVHTVVIPASVKKIADFAFHGSINLESVTFLGNAPQVTENVFGHSGETSQTISQNLIIYYDPTTEGWDDTPLSQYHLVPISEKTK